MGERVIQPPWLRKMLECSFYSNNCSVEDCHRQATTICFSCESEPICEPCSKQNHSDHNTLRVYKASQEVVVRVEQIKMLIDDYRTIHPYSFNHFAILFLHSKGQKCYSKQYPRCEVCHGRLKYWNYRYCSLACKAGFQAENHVSPANSERSNTTKEKADNDTHDQEEVDSDRRRKRRKGTPQRSPLK